MAILKFRAWHPSLKILDFDVNISSDGKLMKLERGLHYIGDCEDSIIMQSTGIKDKNEVEVFEYDILKFHDNYIFEGGIVVYDPSCAKYIVSCKSLKEIDLSDANKLFKIEVIGNKFENLPFWE